MRVVWRILAAAVAPLALSGCLSFGSVATRGTTFDEGVGAMQNRAVLLNIARASQHEPLYFVSANGASAEGQTDFKAGFPPIAEGPGLSLSQKQFTFGTAGTTTLDNLTNTNVQFGVYATHDFYTGLMTPLDLNEIDMLLHQGFARSLLFYLTIDKAKVTSVSIAKDGTVTPNNDSCYLFNDPMRAAETPCHDLTFQLAIFGAMSTGLSTAAPTDEQEPNGVKPSGTPKVVAQASGPSGSGGIQFVLKSDSTPVSVRPCYDMGLQSPAGAQIMGQLKQTFPNFQPNVCGQPKTAATSPSTFVVVNGQPLEIEVSFRSVYGIFRYLGALTDHPDKAPTLGPYNTPDEPAALGRMFDVTTTDPLSFGCFTAVTYEGHRYCAPANGSDAEATKDTFDILVALLALKQSPGDLPASQAVLISP